MNTFWEFQSCGAWYILLTDTSIDNCVIACLLCWQAIKTCCLKNFVYFACWLYLTSCRRNLVSVWRVFFSWEVIMEICIPRTTKDKIVFFKFLSSPQEGTKLWPCVKVWPARCWARSFFRAAWKQRVRGSESEQFFLQLLTSTLVSEQAGVKTQQQTLCSLGAYKARQNQNTAPLRKLGSVTSSRLLKVTSTSN